METAQSDAGFRQFDGVRCVAVYCPPLGAGGCESKPSFPAGVYRRVKALQRLKLIGKARNPVIAPGRCNNSIATVLLRLFDNPKCQPRRASDRVVRFKVVGLEMLDFPTGSPYHKIAGGSPLHFALFRGRTNRDGGRDDLSGFNLLLGWSGCAPTERKYREKKKSVFHIQSLKLNPDYSGKVIILAVGAVAVARRASDELRNLSNIFYCGIFPVFG